MKIKKFYIISTPINGMIAEMGSRAKEALQQSGIILIESFLSAKKTLDLLKVDFTQKTLLELSEHTENMQAHKLLKEVLEVEYASLICDAGTPVFADPGYELVRLLIQQKVELSHIPAISSVLSAIVLSGFDLRTYYFAGFPPREGQDRDIFFKRLSHHKEPIILMDTAYRFQKLLGEVAASFRKHRKVCICFDIGTEEQCIYRGTLEEAQKYYTDQTVKKHPFILVLAKN